MNELSDWKKRALEDSKLSEKQVQVLLHGPKSLTDACFLQAMKFKYSKYPQ